MINYCKNNEEKNFLKEGINLYITKSFNENIPYRAIIVENTSNENKLVTANLQCKGGKNCCFYCDEVASENDIKVDKYLKSKETIAIIIMYYNRSSRFEISLALSNGVKDPVYNHAVFDEKGEDINDRGLKQYVLEKDENSYYIGIDNSGQLCYKVKLILEQVKINNGPFEGQTTPIFEIEPKERKVFESLVLGENPTFEFALA